MRLFDKSRDYEAFEETLAETLAKISLRVCGYCVMPNHWHFVVWPEAELEILRRSVQRGAPYGSASWTTATAEELRLQASLRAPGRPRKNSLPNP